MPNVKIRIEKGSETAGDGQELQERQSESNAKEKIASVSIFATQMIGTAKQTLNYAISNVGVWTGNYVVQDQINKVADAVGEIATIGLGIYTGGIVGGVIAVAGLATKKIFQAISENEAIRHENLQNQYSLERSGNTLKNGSRGTEN